MKPIFRADYVVAQSLGASFNGPAVPTSSSEGLSFQVAWTGATAAGTFKIQASNDSVTWIDLPGLSSVVAGPGAVFWNMASIFFQYARLVFVQTGGTGSVDANVFAKEI
jgi:hypothetical protein